MSPSSAPQPHRVEPASAFMRRFWNDRIARVGGLESVGLEGFGDHYNRLFYVAAAKAVDRAWRIAGARPRNARVLDVGSGVGAWVQHYLDRDVASVRATDVSDAAVRDLEEKFRSDARVASAVAPWGEPHPWLDEADAYDAVNAVGVVAHLLDDDAYEAALCQAYRSLRRGGIILLSDLMPPREVREEEYLRFRTRARHEQALTDAGFRVLGSVPEFAWLNHPKDAASPLGRASDFNLRRIAPQARRFGATARAHAATVFVLDRASVAAGLRISWEILVARRP